MSLRSTYLSCALLALSSIPAVCTPVIYADQTSWLNATTVVSTIGFDGVNTNAGTILANTDSTGLFIGGIDFFGSTSSGGNSLGIADPSAGQLYWDFGTGSLLDWDQFPSSTGFIPSLTITLPQAVTSFGLNVMSNGGSGVNFNVTVNSVMYSAAPTIGWTSTSPTSPHNAFFGFTSDTAFTTIVLQLPSGATYVTPIIDNFAYGTAGTVVGDPPPPPPGDTPEPATFLSISSGLIGLAVMARRFRRSATPAI